MSDRERLRMLSHQWMEIAGQPAMQERKRLWRDLHSLKSARPMLLVETGYIRDYVAQSELLCEDPYLRGIERMMLETIRHAAEVGDDIVVEPYLRMGWVVNQPSFGVDIIMQSGKAQDDSTLAYVFNHSIQVPEDMKKLASRRFSIDREKTTQQKALLEDAFGDILPVRLGNFEFFSGDPGDYSWAGNFFFGLTWQLHRFIGLEGMMYWYYDYPDAMHAMMEYMVQDRLSMFEELEKNGCLVPNTDNQMAGPRFYGYCEDLPAPDESACSLKQMWAWAESQESSSISLGMYKEFVLPYLQKMAGRFGLLYYGCCEPVHDKFEAVKKALPNLRAVSVSGWNNFDTVGDIIGKEYVYSRKPISLPLSCAAPDWEAAKLDLEKTKRSAKGNLEILYRDLYDIHGDRKRLSDWAKLAKKVFEL